MKQEIIQKGIIFLLLMTFSVNNSNSQNNFIWGIQSGTDKEEYVLNHVADNNGNIYVSGKTTGLIAGHNSGKNDGFIIKLDAEGNNVFINQFGTPGDDNCIAITGDTSSRIFICGSTWGDIATKNNGMVDAFAGSFADNGKLIKMTQFGSDGFDMALQLTIDDKEYIYVGGSTSGNLAGNQLGDGDCFLTKINNKGEIVWINQFGTKRHDGVRGIAFNKTMSDNILVSGIMNLAPSFAFIRMYKDDGSLLWERNFAAKGTQAGTSGKDISMDDNGNIYHLGLTKANMFGPLIGEYDYYLVKLGLDRIYMNR